MGEVYTQPLSFFSYSSLYLKTKDELGQVNIAYLMLFSGSWYVIIICKKKLEQ